MNRRWDRREFLALAGLGGVVFASGLGCGRAHANDDDFFFLQLSDTHWGYRGAANPESETCLKKTVAAINQSATQPDFVVFTGDLTHMTEDPKERRARMTQFREIAGNLKAKKVLFLPGEHDAEKDRGEAYKEAFGALYQSFEHRGVHFVAIDNASAPGGEIGEAQLGWLAAEVAKVPKNARLVALSHRPLFDLYPSWDWATKDGARAIEILARHGNVSAFYGHIHQEHHHQTGSVVHHAARSLIFPLPAPGAQPARAPLPWNAASADHGLGHRKIDLSPGGVRAEEIAFR
jgi:Icc-related predicted phosphoesterase